MLRSLADARGWRACFRRRPVVLSAPHPPDECLRRLATVTTRRSAASWYLDSRTVGRPEPRLRGEAGPAEIFVARFHDASGRNGFVPWLDARLEPAAGGGATLTGTIGLHPDSVRGTLVIAAGGAVITLAMVAGGISLLVRGQLNGLPLTLAAFFMMTLFAGFSFAGLRSLERDIPPLIQEINGVLDATA